MCPRAVLHATAICLLLAAATVSAEAQIPAAVQKAPTAQKGALAPLKAESTFKVWEQPLPKVLDPLGRTGSTFKVWEQPLPKVLDPLGRAESTLKAPELTAAQKQRAGLEQLLKEVPDPQLKPLSKILLHKTGFLGFSPVPGAVKQFSTDFEKGAKNPEQFMSAVRPELVEKWNKAPQEKRIFVIGAGKDSAKVSEWAKSIESDGYIVFFYKFCNPLCSSKAVGAMCKTSGTTMVYQTPSAELSEYVKVEAATAGFIEGLNDKVVLISTSEFLAAKSFTMYVANMPTLTPSPVK